MTDKSYSRPWAAPLAKSAISAQISIPGSKSLTNRELVLSALASGPSEILNPLESRDSSLMIEALRQLGSEIHQGQFLVQLRLIVGLPEQLCALFLQLQLLQRVRSLSMEMLPQDQGR